MNDAIAIETATANTKAERMISVLQRPSLLALKEDRQLDSSLRQQQSTSATLMRTYLEARLAVKSLESEIRSHEGSLEYHQQLMVALNGEEAANSKRVLAQLQLKLPSLRSELETVAFPKFQRSRAEANEAHRRMQNLAQRFRHPVVNRPDFSNNILLHAVQRRMALGPKSTFPSRNALLHHRLTHVVTINTHLNYPVYCLKFDATGRYFVTGADDFLVKVFRTVEGGAVLVCTLKGHAGVINDIEVSSDNGFLATASEDGDVRVWGLRDGCPVAILRGHGGGANMVAWSGLVPHRLVTTGADGLARIWDIRKACLKRYSRWVGSRPEYTLKLNGVSFKSEEAAANAPVVELTGRLALPPIPPPAREEPNAFQPNLPPVPPTQPLAGQETNDTVHTSVAAAAAPALPPGLPPANNQVIDDGRFVANNHLDAGVKLIAKLQHGEIVGEDGPGTRTRTSLVKVICVALCPHGGHFATGSDDGKLQSEPQYILTSFCTQVNAAFGLKTPVLELIGLTGQDQNLGTRFHLTSP